MKKIITALLVTVMALVLFTACGAEEPKIVDIKFDLPEGFIKADLSGYDTWVTEGYDSGEDLTNIIFYADKNNTLSYKSFKNLDKSFFEEDLNAGLSAEFEDTITIVFDSFEHMEIDGVEAIVCSYHYDVYGLMTISQIQGLYNTPDKAYVITCTEAYESGWMERFENCLKSVTFVREG